ncbi:hypothetical protein DYB25_011387 [Aphanomyces astaci]|uniref:Uncharacterized protein n=1 Tax=Aphanomyces astaci TaxID=112090 RepID=A0A397EXR7_APHAT|nr:hypothetical protein DYB25_011387 [Aphanomyces astaci]RHZ02792.1 hypothetical protein DYB31_013698 [Aphanomyces astaci]
MFIRSLIKKGLRFSMMFVSATRRRVRLAGHASRSMSFFDKMFSYGGNDDVKASSAGGSSGYQLALLGYVAGTMFPKDSLKRILTNDPGFLMGHDTISRVLPQWQTNHQGYSHLMSLQAFAVQERGDFAAAESLAHRSMSMNNEDGSALYWRLRFAGFDVPFVLEELDRQWTAVVKDAETVPLSPLAALHAHVRLRLVSFRLDVVWLLERVLVASTRIGRPANLG